MKIRTNPKMKNNIKINFGWRSAKLNSEELSLPGLLGIKVY